jgi:hypothetical protein
LAEEHDPTTQELRTVQTTREQSERKAAAEATTENAERAHRRRADKAAYLEERLAEQQRSEEDQA